MTWGGFVHRALPWLAALVCVTYLSTMRDVPSWLAVPRAPIAPPVPASVTDRDAELRVEVTDERGAMVPDAEVTVLSIQGDRAYLAGKAKTDSAGIATIRGLPRGETFVLAESEGRQRASNRLVLGKDIATARLLLRKAHELSVRVTDEDQRPIAKATLELRGGDPLPFGGTTDARGAATIGRLGPSPWSLRVSAPGYETAVRTGLASSAFPTQIVLRALGSLLVHVVDPEGTPAEGAKVTVVGSHLWPARSGTSDASGSVRIASIPAGAYDVAAAKGDLVSETSIGNAVKKGDTKELTLKLGAGRQVTVKVVTEGDFGTAPVPRASVVLAEDGIASFPREGVTGDDGLVTLGPIGTRSGGVAARADGFVARAGIPVPAVLEGPLVVTLSRGATLRGDVVDDRDFPVGGASIEIIGVDFAGMPIDETPANIAFRAAHFAWALPGPPPLIPAGELGVMPGPLPHIPRVGESILPPSMQRPGGDAPLPEPWVTNVDGQFRASPVPPGRVRALVRHPGYVEAMSALVTLTPGGEASVHIVLRPGATLSGRVVDPSGQPVAGSRVEVAATHGTLVRSTVTADDGTFAFAAIPAEITIGISRPDSFEAVVVKKTLTLKEGERHEETFTLPEPREPIRVRVVDDRGYPLDAVQITALSLATDTPLRATRFTGKEGVAIVEDATGLALRLEISLPGHAPQVKTFDKADAQIAITLGRGSVVGGDVTTRGGHDAVEGAEITIYASTGARHAKTDDAGKYVVRDLPPGRARVVVTKKGFAKVERAIDIAEGDGEHAAPLERIDLDEAGAIEGEVVDKDGNPVVGARVAVGAVPAYVPLGALPAGIVVTDSRGRFALADVPVGDAEVEAYAPDRGRGRERAIKVYAGRPTTDVRVKLDADASGDDAAASGGVAVTLGEGTSNGKRAVVVVLVAPGSEAERAGVQPDDVLVAVDDHTTRTLEAAHKRLAGPVGDDVVVKLLRGGEPVTLRIARERVRR